MLKKTITYEDYNGETRTEDFYFSLNKAELLKMNLSIPGGLEAHIKRMVHTRDIPNLIKLVDDLILKSYGIKAPDGRGFHKSEELSRDFMETEAYVELITELFSGGEEKVSQFIEGILPNSLVAQVKLNQAKAEREKENLTVVDRTAEPVG